jgi:methylated-DNA-[protein]-cysteine S-methyltransferase
MQISSMKGIALEESQYCFDSIIGRIALSCRLRGLSSVFLGAPDAVSDNRKQTAPLLIEASRQLNEYLAHKRTQFDLPLDWSEIRGFQRDVLELTYLIPFGTVLTYGEIARRLGKPAACRAVGAALGRNPLPIFIPCHRVVAANGALTGYSAAEGIRTKAWLLTLEGQRVVNSKLG